MSSKLERRAVAMKEMRVKKQDDVENSMPIIEGYAAVFDEWSLPLGNWFPFKEKVIPGAFEETIKEDDIRSLFNHDPNYVLGRNRSGTLLLTEDETGLKVIINPPDTQWARDLCVSIERGDIANMSFGFEVVSDRWGLEDGEDIRELLKVKLWEVSIVTFPAYPQTEVGIRSIKEIFDLRPKVQAETAEQVDKQSEQREISFALLEREIALKEKELV